MALLGATVSSGRPRFRPDERDEGFCEVAVFRTQSHFCLLLLDAELADLQDMSSLLGKDFGLAHDEVDIFLLHFGPFA